MSKLANNSPQAGIYSNMEAIRKKLQSCVPDPYILEWDGRPQVPIRYKINTIPDKVETYNLLWAEAITKRTGRKYEEENENYLKFCIPYEESTVYISLFQRTGTVMFQGNKSPYWADHNLLNICKEVESDKKGYLRPTHCIVCKEIGTNDMIVCDEEDCDKWTHHSCVSISDEEARNLTFKCKACTKNRPENPNLRNHENVTSTPLAKDKAREESSQHSSEDSHISSVSEINISSSISSSKDSSLISQKENLENLSKINYLRGLENKFMELAKDDSGNSESPSINGIKEIIQKVRESIAEELSQTRMSNNSENSITNENDPSIISTAPKVTNMNPLQFLYSSLPYAHRETNAILEQNIQILKEENSIKNIEIEGLKDKIKSLENLLELKNTPPSKEKHRLEYRDTKSIINEYKLLEDRNKMLNLQLSEAQKEKLIYKKNHAILQAENDELQQGLNQAREHQKMLQAPVPPVRYNKINKLKEKISDLKEQLEASNNVKQELETEINDKDHQISNLQQQIDIDENVKQNLNDLLEIAYSEINDLREKVHDTTFIIPNEDGLHEIPWREEQVESTYADDQIEEQSEITYAQMLKKQNQYDRLVNNEANEFDLPSSLQNKNNPPNIQNNEQRKSVNLHRGRTKNNQYNGQYKTYQNIYSRAEKRRREEIEYERTKNRPVCPWFLENKCHSDVCVYKHPSEHRDESKISLDVSSTKSNEYVTICKYSLENRCWFGEQCRNVHPNKN